MALLEVTDLHTEFAVGKKTLRAVDGVSFTLEQGESLGLVGESGCGKTTTALSIIKLLPGNAKITSGSILYQGEEVTKKTRKGIRDMRWKEISIVFQGAMNALNPVMTIGDQIADAILLHENISKEAVKARIAELLERVEIDRKRATNYPHEFSGGMRQRAMIAMALACNPKIIIGDEPTTALDVMVQAQIFDLLERLRRELRMAMILITHDLSAMTDTCDKAAIMYAGKIVEYVRVEDLFTEAAHPYTRLLMSSYPRIGSERKMIDSIPGIVPDLTDPPKGCRFCDRCPEAMPICRETPPPEILLPGEHRVSCHLPTLMKKEGAKHV